MADVIDDRLKAVVPDDAGEKQAGLPTFTLLKVGVFRKPGLEEELMPPPGGRANPCTCNAVCPCVMVGQCACNQVCTCDSVQSSCLCYSKCCHKIVIFRPCGKCAK